MKASFCLPQTGRDMGHITQAGSATHVLRSLCVLLGERGLGDIAYTSESKRSKRLGGTLGPQFTLGSSEIMLHCKVWLSFAYPRFGPGSQRKMVNPEKGFPCCGFRLAGQLPGTKFHRARVLLQPLASS